MMMRALTFLFAFSSLFLFGCKPRSQRDRVSYTIGARFGGSLKSQNLDLNTGALCQGLKDGYAGHKLELTETEMRDSIQKLSRDQQSKMHEQADKNKAKAEAFLKDNKTKDGVKVTADGLQYKILKEGTGPSPKGDDVVVVNYKGTLIDGTEFDSSYKRHEPARFPLKGVIPGWTEGLQLMKKGGKAIFYVPPALGYGDRQRQVIPANSVLIFEVELLDVVNPQKAKRR